MKKYNFINYCVFLIASLISLNCWALGVTTYYHDDHLGSPVYASDDFGQVEWQQRYKPFGEKLNNSSPTQKNDIWYTGKPHDDDTGLTYMNARYYDPVVGRFMAIDPVGFVDANTMSFNRYLYVNNNPYKYNDPDGEFLNFVVGGAIAAFQNVAIQNIEIALGVRQSFSYGELAVETALGVVTSGASTVKNGGRLAVTAVQYSNRVDNVGDTVKIADKTANSAIGFADDATGAALSNIGRVDHAARHLIDAGLIKANSGSKAAREAFQEIAQGILTNPTKTFDHVMSSGKQAVKGFYGQVDGSDVIIFVAKDAQGKVKAGDIVTSITPSALQMRNFGL